MTTPSESFSVHYSPVIAELRWHMAWYTVSTIKQITYKLHTLRKISGSHSSLGEASSPLGHGTVALSERFPTFWSIMVLSPSRAPPSLYSICQCYFSGYHPYPTALSHFPISITNLSSHLLTMNKHSATSFHFTYSSWPAWSLKMMAPRFFER